MERRTLLVGIATTAVSTPMLVRALPFEDSLRPRPPDDPAAARLARAQEFASGLDRHAARNVGDFLYHAGIVSQLGLTAYLFDQGADDEWCREKLGLDVAKALAFANHLGLGHDCERMTDLARLLGSYGQWRRPFEADGPDASAIQPSTAAIDVARLIERVERRLAEGALSPDARRGAMARCQLNRKIFLLS